MGILGKLFGSDKIIDGAIKGIDAMVFTDEEKTKAHMEFLKLYEPFKIAQRLLALIFSIPYVLFACYGLAMGDSQIINGANEIFGTPVALIIGFYFMGGTLNSLKKGN